MPRGTILSDIECGKIDVLKELNMSNRDIAKRIKRSHGAVNKYLKNGSGHHLGQQKKIKERDKQKIIKLATKQGLSTRKIANLPSINFSKKIHRLLAPVSLHPFTCTRISCTLDNLHPK